MVGISTSVMSSVEPIFRASRGTDFFFVKVDMFLFVVLW